MPVPSPELSPEHEAAGLFRAVKYVHRFAKRKEPITSGCVFELHRKLFFKAHPDYRGRLRQDEAKIRSRSLVLPHPSQIPQLLKEFGDNLDKFLNKLNEEGLRIPDSSTDLSDPMVLGYYHKIFWTAAWVQRTIAYIHPFSNGNGRVARLFTNLILEMYGLPGVSVRIEDKSKARYLDALQQADKAIEKGYGGPYEDYDNLVGILAEGFAKRYEDRISRR